MDAIQYTPNGDTLFYESYFHIFFKSSPLAVLEAEYEFNRDFALGLNEPSFTRLYSLFDIVPPDEATNIGWSYDYIANEWDTYWVDFIHRPQLTGDGTPYIEISYPIPPAPMDFDPNY